MGIGRKRYGTSVWVEQPRIMGTLIILRELQQPQNQNYFEYNIDICILFIILTIDDPQQTLDEGPIHLIQYENSIVAPILLGRSYIFASILFDGFETIS